MSIKPRQYKFDEYHRYLIREDQANNLRLKACLQFCNLHDRLLFQMKTKKTNAMSSRHRCQFFPKGRRQREKIFIEILFSSFKK